MSLFQVLHSGSLRNTERFLKLMAKASFGQTLQAAAQKGAAALAAATPVDSGLTAASWGYEIQRTKGSWSIEWTNSHIENGFPVVIGLQYGHGTGTGGWVRGRDFINPAIQPIFEQTIDDVWKEVTSA